MKLTAIGDLHLLHVGVRLDALAIVADLLDRAPDDGADRDIVRVAASLDVMVTVPPLRVDVVVVASLEVRTVPVLRRCLPAPGRVRRYVNEEHALYLGIGLFERIDGDVVRDHVRVARIGSVNGVSSMSPTAD